MLGEATKPLIVAGGGGTTLAEEELRAFAERHNIPVVETVAARPRCCRRTGSTPGPSARRLHLGQRAAAEADVVLAVGSRLQDFTTGSWTVFANESVRFIGLNTATFDAVKHLAHPLVADAREGLRELSARRDLAGPDDWTERAAVETAQYHAYIDKIASPSVSAEEEKPTYAQVVGAVDRLALPPTTPSPRRAAFRRAEQRLAGQGSRLDRHGVRLLVHGLRDLGRGSKMALPEREVIVFVGDGSYLMMNSDLYSSVLLGHKLIVIVCDNGGFAVINRLQVNQGRRSTTSSPTRRCRRWWRSTSCPCRAMGCRSENVTSDARAGGGDGAGPGVGPDLRDRGPDLGLRLDGWRALGGRRARGQRTAGRRGCREAMDAGKAAQRVGW